MTTFIVIAALLALGAAALIAVPLVRPRQDGVPPSAIAAVVCVLLVAAGAAGLYPVWGDWSWARAPDEGSPEGMVGRLARRLEKQPEDLNGWLLLGRSYAQLEQFPLAVKAYRRADRLAGGRSAEALSGLGEALVLSEQGELRGEAGRLFEKALEIDPRQIRALFYGAIAAYERGEYPVARERFQLLLTGDTPPQIRDLIERQLAAMDARQAEATASAGDAAADAPVLKVRVNIDPGVSAQAQPGAPLFVSVRLAGQAGPPLVARRLDARFPQDVDLGASDAMIAGRGLAVGQEVEITARVANGGSAAPRTGDPVGTVRHRIGASDGRLELRIDRLTP